MPALLFSPVALYAPETGSYGRIVTLIRMTITVHAGTLQGGLTSISVFPAAMARQWNAEVEVPVTGPELMSWRNAGSDRATQPCIAEDRGATRVRSSPTCS